MYSVDSHVPHIYIIEYVIRAYVYWWNFSHEFAFVKRMMMMTLNKYGNGAQSIPIKQNT